MMFFTAFMALFVMTVSDSIDGEVLYIDSEKIIKNSCLQYETKFNIDITLEQWNRVLDNIYLMGKLWEIYGFTPRYKVSTRGSDFHIVDPTGIEGDLIEVSQSKNKRIYYARGKMKHRGLPFVVTGKVLFLLDYSYSRGTVSCRLSIYGEGSGTAIDLLIQAVSPVLKVFIHKRVKNNVRDLNILVTDIMQNPTKIRASIPAGLIGDFDRLAGKK
jgi:hypothetical protein